MRERWAGKDLVLYNPRRGRMHVLNAPAALIWRLCDGSKTRDDIVARLREEFEVGQGEDPDRDVGEILRLLSEEELLDNTRSGNAVSATADSHRKEGSSS